VQFRTVFQLVFQLKIKNATNFINQYLTERIQITPAHQLSTTKPAKCGLCRIWPSHPAPTAKNQSLPTHLNAHADDAHPENAHADDASAYAHADDCAAPFHPTQTRAHADDARRVYDDAHA
jgi:hypothetical protein